MTEATVDNEQNTVALKMVPGDTITVEIYGGKGVRIFEIHMDRQGNTEMTV